MKKIIAGLLMVCLLLCCACGSKQPVQKKSRPFEGYTVAFNPAVKGEDGKIISLRNSTASSVKNDLKQKNYASLYEETDWRVLSHTGVSAWNINKIRKLDLLVNSDGSPYAYFTDDNDTGAITVYDSSKIDIKGMFGAQIGNTGVMLSLNGGNETAVCYTVPADGTFGYFDNDGGNIALVETVAGKNVNALGENGFKQSLLLRVYVNNRIYWQEILNSSKPEVPFPDFRNIELTAGDAILFSVEATDETEGIICGNCDIPAKYVTEAVGIKNTETVQVVKDAPIKKEIPFNILNESQFAYIVSDKATKEQRDEFNSFISSVSERIETDAYTYTDAESADKDYLVLYGETRYSESIDVMNEIKAHRKNNSADFIIRFVNNKLVIAALNEVSLKFATEFFLNNYCKNDESVIPTDLNYVSADYNPCADLKLAGNSVSKYRIVMPTNASMFDYEIANYLRREIIRSTGNTVEIVRDYLSAANYEIVLGETNRTNSSYSKLAYSKDTAGYKINVEKNRTVIHAGGQAALNAGVNALLERLRTRKSLSAGYTDAGKYDNGYSMVGGYKLSWSDEFNGKAYDKCWIKGGIDSKPNQIGGMAIFDGSTSVVENGALVQKLVRDGNDILHAGLISKGQLEYRYGYIEIRVKFSPLDGIYSAFWLVGNFNSEACAEIDIYENFCKTYGIQCNVHLWGNEHEVLEGSTKWVDSVNPLTGGRGDMSAEYHTIGMKWNKGKVEFYLDGVKYNEATYNTRNIRQSSLDLPAHLLFTLDGTFITDTKFAGTQVSYDWVRIYQQDDEDSLLYMKSSE